MWSSLSLGGAVLLLVTSSAEAFSLRSSTPPAGTDVDTVLSLSPAAFGRLARSESFYRSTRQDSGNVCQQVLEISKWAPRQGASSRSTTATNGSGIGGQAASNAVARSLAPAPSAPPANGEEQRHHQQQQQQQQQEEDLCREARLVYAISTPFGSSDATVFQEHSLCLRPCGEIYYSEAHCITGFPMVPGVLTVKTTFAVTPAEGDPGSVRVRVGVVVGDVSLPKALRWLKPRVTKIIGADGQKQATKWLEEMMASEARGGDA